MKIFPAFPYLYQVKIFSRKLFFLVKIHYMYTSQEAVNTFTFQVFFKCLPEEEKKKKGIVC